MNNRSSSGASSISSTQLVWIVCMALALYLQVAFGSPTAHRSSRSPPALLTHHLTKRSFFDIQCKGVYDKSIFARLDRICEDCYNLFREPQLHSLCRSQCFTTKYFKGCVESLLMSEDMPRFTKMIEYLAK